MKQVNKRPKVAWLRTKAAAQELNLYFEQEWLRKEKETLSMYAIF
jgi:hypothetical protein